MVKKKVMFLCTQNSARSQMAEGILRHFYGNNFEVFSAGSHPSNVNPKSIEVMDEIGINISHHRSKSLKEFLGQEFDFVITVCDKARATCPFFPGTATKYLHWSFPDPAEATGSEEEIRVVFREIRDDLKSKIEKELGKK